MSDIVKRLSAGICDDPCRVKDIPSGCACAEAAARIEQLEAALRVSERAATRIALEAEKVCLQNIQMKFALGYPMPADLERHVLPENPFKCGVCAARAALEEKA